MSAQISEPDQRWQEGTFVARENRFVVRAILDADEGRPPEIRAYLPNTARLTELLVPGAKLILRPNDHHRRLTRWTVTRVWDGTWVALQASAANVLVADHLESGGQVPDWHAITAPLRREVVRGRHRFDLETSLADGRLGIIEVKSLSRAVAGVAPLSDTPSTRGVAHLSALTRLVAAGTPAAVVFVVQREDVTALDIGAPADRAWQEAVQSAIAGQVHVAAFRCRVNPLTVTLHTPLPVVGVAGG